MSYERFIGLRYLMAKQRSNVLSIITLISIFGVALGVTALIVVLSVMGGFKKDLTDKILGARAHIVIQAPDYAALDDAAGVADQALQTPGVIGASPFIESEVMISSPTNLSGVVLRGVDPTRVKTVSDLANEIVEGKLEYLTDPTPLIEEIRTTRDRDLEELLDRLDRERSDLEKEIQGKGKGQGPGAKGEGLGRGQGDSKLGAGEGFMPPIFDDVELEDEDQQAEAEGFMPSMFGDLESGEEEAEGFMPSMFDEPAEDVAGMPPITNERARPKGPKLPGLIIGPELAKSLQVKLGDEVNVVTPRGEMGPMGPIPRSRPFRIVGVFYSGMYEYDANFAYTHLDDAADFLSQAGATGVELKTNDINAAVAIAENLQRALGPSVQVLDWQEMNRSLFFALKLEKIAMFVVLAFIILVASFSIVAMLIMIVIEKGREIAILKSMGASDAGIMRTFVLQGTVIGTIGTVLGLILGLAICYYLQAVGFPLNSEVYYISTLPVEVDPLEITAVVICSIGISLLATIYPSYQAARLKPVDGLRYD